MKVDVRTLNGGKTAGSVDLDEGIFGLEPRSDILQRMVVWQLAKRRAGTRKTQSRSEVTGSTRKAIRQKGTGGARHGNRKAPQFRGGGKAMGPVVRSHAIGLPKKVRALALRHALSAKQASGALIVLDDARLEAPKTKELRRAFEDMGVRSALVIGGTEIDDNFRRAARNMPLVDVLPAAGLNVYDILRRDTLVLTRAALEQVEARFK
ncbi:MAG: 50S ribosomal protein L4 [Alphaproteobacteria bacterium]